MLKGTRNGNVQKKRLERSRRLFSRADGTNTLVHVIFLTRLPLYNKFSGVIKNYQRKEKNTQR